ncbi:hypothetical protein ACFFX0_29160 [Citricoccus parietis]|uniref:Uncharacterized protein n=1 Tax=Citricoccus parietis TaxID=592307 RepID=A0ABV5G8U2_9MICC
MQPNSTVPASTESARSVEGLGRGAASAAGCTVGCAAGVGADSAGGGACSGAGCGWGLRSAARRLPGDAPAFRPGPLRSGTGARVPACGDLRPAGPGLRT